MLPENHVIGRPKCMHKQGQLWSTGSQVMLYIWKENHVMGEWKPPPPPRVRSVCVLSRMQRLNSSWAVGMPALNQVSASGTKRSAQLLA